MNLLQTTPTILVVDDDLHTRRSLARIVRRLGYQVHTARDGIEALVVLEQQPEIGLIFLDQDMPNLNGMETLEIVRSLEDKGPSVVFVTGNGNDEDIIEGYNAGADYYITKPYQPRQIARIAEYLVGQLSPSDSARVELGL